VAKFRIRAVKNPTLYLSKFVFTASRSSAFALLTIVGWGSLMLGFASPVQAQSVAKAAVSCWATKASSNDVRVTWTPANNDNADRYTIERSRDGSAYHWKSTVSKQARSSIVTEWQEGSLRYRVKTISASGSHAFTYCGPSGGLQHHGASTPVAVASCWATRLANNSVRITWTPRPNDGADRYTVMQSRNHGRYRWIDTVARDKIASTFPLDGFGNYRFQVRTVAHNGAYVVRDCGPDGGITGEATKITVMPIGDSITRGGNHRPAYRYPMQEFNKPGDNRYIGCEIDFVGSADIRVRDENAPSLSALPTGEYGNGEYDHHHASWGGNTVGQIHLKVDEQLDLHKPDAVLIHAGTNDILNVNIDLMGDSKRELRAMINSIRQKSPKTVIFVAKVIRPGAAKHQKRVDNWNASVAEVVAETGHETRLVDMDVIWPRRTEWSPNITPAQVAKNELFAKLTMFRESEGWDGVHPSIEGSRVLAGRWLEEMQKAHLCP